MKPNIIKTCVFGALALGVMIVIFIFSQQTGATSSQASNGVGKFILSLLGVTVPEGQSPSSVVLFWGLTVRSLAHIFLFAMLGLFSFLAFYYGYAIRAGKTRLTLFSAAASAFLFSLIYAVSDEVHQYFIAGRTSSPRDVFIDACGFTCAIIIACAVTFLSLPRAEGGNAGSRG